MRKIVSLPDVSVQRSVSSIRKASATSNLGNVSRQQPVTRLTRIDKVVPATWKYGRMLK
ncbi:hypothetical protein D3C87_2070110 [compost metagenome]